MLALVEGKRITRMAQTMQTRLFTELSSILVIVACWAVTSHADDEAQSVGGTTPVGVPGQPGVPVIGPDGKPMKPSGKPANVGDESQAKPADDAKKPESPEPKVIRRDAKESGDADPDELKATVGDDGRVAFEFRNQPWIDLVQWLAEISKLPLDWQELPADRVNLTSSGRYTVEEACDLFNRHLLARGYTLLKMDGGLIVAKTENINPAIVPRVEPEQLAGLTPHTFVRTSLDVGWLSAEKLAEELKPMISSNGRLTALTSTNRIEAMDAAINLLQISVLLDQERDLSSREALAPEFRLRYLPAEEAKLMLEEFLGVKKEKEAPMSPQQMQMMQQMRQQNGNQPEPPKKEKEVSIVANVRQNSIIIRAERDRIAIATEFLKRVDVPSDTMVSLSDIQSRVQVYRLASLDPEKLLEIVSEMNVLEPSTRMRVDKENKALIVSGSGADRFIISSLIERLDGSGRKFEVLQLRRLDATEVAESIEFLMGKKKEEKQDSRRSYYYYDPFSRDEKKPDGDDFRVAANERYRQILIWANEIEMEEVRSLLVKLGELPPEGGSRQPFRVIDAAATPETYEYLQQLRTQWQRLAPNDIELPAPESFKDPNADAKSNAEAAIDDEAPTDDEAPEKTDSRAIELDENKVPPEDVTSHSEPRDTKTNTNTLVQITSAHVAADEDSTAPPTIESARDFDRMFRGGDQRKSGAPPPARDQSQENTKPAPIQITIDRNGNLLLTSEDTKALDRLEDLMLQVAPPQRPYRVFAIKNASASWMLLNLEDYFKDAEESGDKDSDRFFGWYFGIDDNKKDSKKPGLGAGVKLRFVSDNDTNTIVVSGATSEQLKTIAELIELWDVPEPVNKRKTRFTKLIPVTYGKADKIAETVKDAYRDLLSSNDKAFQKSPGGKPSGESKDEPRNRGGNGTGFVDAGSGNEGGGEDFSFKGKLSIGIDAIGNTLLVSAEGEPLLELVSDMIKQLDEAAQPRGEVEVIQLSGGLSGRTLEDALQAFGTASKQKSSIDRPKRSQEPSKE